MTGDDATIGGDLTPREREVLAMVASGLTNREIGEALFISESTAGVHVSHLMAKLGVGSRTEAAAWAYRAGLVEAAPGTVTDDVRSGDLGSTHPFEPRSGWLERLREGLRQRESRVALAIGGVVVLVVITVGLAIAVLNGRQPAVGDLSSASANPSPEASPSTSVEPRGSATAAASVAPSAEESPPAATSSPTQIPLPRGTWSATGTMSLRRFYPTATLLRDGTVLVAGGSDIMTTSYRSTEIYRPNSGEWTTASEMVEDRMRHSATLLADGTVLVAAGFALGGPTGTSRILAAAELFDPNTGTWHATSPLNVARWGHTATLLADGTLVVVEVDPTTSQAAATSRRRSMTRAPRHGPQSPRCRRDAGHTPRHSSTMGPC